VTVLWRQAEEILDTALAAEENSPGTAILIDRQGGVRMFDATGWTIEALTAEFGASSLFRVAKSGGVTSVEALSGCDRCILERRAGYGPAAGRIPAPEVCHPIRLQAAPLLLAQSDSPFSAV
jgi:hypothetical protein